MQPKLDNTASEEIPNRRLRQAQRSVSQHHPNASPIKMPHPQHLVNVAVSIFPLSLVVFIYERALVPIYGSVPTNHLLDKTLVAALVISAVQPFTFSLSQKAFLTALLFAAAPNATYWVAVLSARNRDPVWGPAITHVVVLVPMVVFLSSFMVGSRRKVSAGWVSRNEFDHIGSRRAY